MQTRGNRVKRNRSMARERGRRRPAASGAVRTSAAYDLRKNLFTIVLWTLGVINAVLIFSFVSKHFLTGDERQISAVDEVAEAPAQVLKIEVLNGCGVQGLAKKWADYLRSAGFDPWNVTNFEQSNVARTMIIDRLSNARSNGLAVAEALGLPEDYVAYQASDQRQVAVTVIIGLDYDRIDIAKK